MDITHSSHDFVRSLKAISDPPLVGGPSKIEIAQQAWEDASFYVPNKAGVIVDWILTKFLKDKGKEISLNPVFDKRYWRLLLELVTSPGTHRKGAIDSRSVRTWLAPLLHRIPVGPAVVAFLNSFVHVHEAERRQLSDLANSCLTILWPLAVQRMNGELLLECFGSLLGFLFSNPLDAGFAKSGQLVINSYRNSLNNSSNKRKLHQTFLQSHLYNWLYAVAMDFGTHESLKSGVVEAGIDTIFNLDILRQIQDGNAESALLQNLRTLNKSHGKLVMETLPQLYVHYVHSLKKHRGALFGQGSQHTGGTALDELHGAGVRFFVSCEEILRDNDQTSSVWATRIALLQIVNQENFFHRKQPNTQVLLNQLLETSLTALNDSWKTTHCQTTALALKCLSMLIHDDFDLVIPVLPSILVRVLQIPEFRGDHFDFLAALVDYHIQTRTMSNLIESLLESIISERPPCPNRGQERYQVECSSPIMNTMHLDRLSKALHNSLTTNQCLPTVKHIFGTLKNLWELYNVMSHKQDGDGAVRAQKKRKTSTAATANGSEVEELAVTYCLVANLTSIVLPSLPVQSLPSDILMELRACIVDFRTEFVHHTISKALKVLKKQRDIDAWSSEVILTSTLRLLYSLDTSKSPSLPPNYRTKLFKKLADLSGNDKLLPELTLELFRVLLCSASSCDDPQKVEDLMEQLLRYLENHFCPADVQWSGQAHHLTKIEPGRAECALAIIYTIFVRWLPVIDHSASPHQLERLLNIMMAIDISRMTPSEMYLQPEQVFLQALHSAHFWELRNVRSVLLNILDKNTGPLDSTVIDQLELALILEKVATFRLLLFFPMEYFPGKNLSVLIKRAMAVDDVLSPLPFAQNTTVPGALIVIRVFLKRAHLQGGLSTTLPSPDLSSCILNLFKEQDGKNPSSDRKFIRATLDLMEVYFRKLLKTSKNGGTKSLLDILALYDQNAFNTSVGIRAQSFIEFIDLLTREFPVNSLHEDIATAIRDLHRNISSSLLPRVVLSSERKIKDDQDVIQLIGLTSGWYRLLCLGEWLGSTTISDPSIPIPFIGEKVVSGLLSCRESDTSLRNEGMNNLKVLTFAITLQELGHRPETEHPLHVNFIVGVYISFYNAVSPSSRRQLDVHFGRSCKGMSLTDFAYLLSLVSDALSDLRCLSTSQLISLVHLSALLLKEHPSHTLAHIQKFATRCINEFAGRSIFVHGPLQLRLRVLDLLAQHCSDQQAALRSMDIAGIWLFLSKTLAPSQIHDQDTSVMIFHKIIAISSSLIRLRRDLVTSTLPHLSMVLRQLLLSTRACRPNLGAKQKTIVMNTQPQWISASHPLRAEEGKALGRLLESLNTKTTVRLLTSSTSASQKAESLAKPFSKHAAYVLQAYIEAMNDSLCILSSEVRKELEPGLFALCGMMNEHSRDALMVSALDAGGKATLKALWKEYEKQRYVGKG